MGVILPNSFADDAIASADDAMENFHDPIADSLYSALNGDLDRTNAPGVAFGPRSIRPRSQSAGQMVGKTGVMDFFGDSEGVFPPDRTFDSPFKPLPGSAIEFHIPYAHTVVNFSWQLLVSNDMDTAGECFVQFFLDASAVPATRRLIPRHIFSNYEGIKQTRYIACHFSTSALTRGFHNAYVGLFSQADITRVKVRNMKFVRMF